MKDSNIEPLGCLALRSRGWNPIKQYENNIGPFSVPPPFPFPPRILALQAFECPGPSLNVCCNLEHQTTILIHILVPYLLTILGKGLTDKQASDGLKVQAFLLFNEKQSFRKLGDIIYQQSKSGEIYVRRDALTVIFDDNKILYGNLVTYGGNGLRQLWKLVFSKGSTLLGKGLMALGLQNAAIIWTNRKPAELGNVTGN